MLYVFSYIMPICTVNTTGFLWKNNGEGECFEAYK